MDINLFNNIFGKVQIRTDSYKISHAGMYRPDLTKIYSYFEARGFDKSKGVPFDSVVSFGYQYILNMYLAGNVVTPADTEYVSHRYNEHFGREIFDKKGWLRLYEKHKGILPVSIKVAPEGLVVPLHNVLMTVENTDPEFPWLTNFLETHLTQVWYPCTVATHSREMYKLIMAYLIKTGTPELIDSRMHDFGCRGVASMEQAGLGGAAHLTSFQGTDTCPALELVKFIYEKEMAGYSIPATEHSITSSNGGPKGELPLFRRLLQLFPTGMFACVSDTYNIYNACQEYWGKELRDQVLQRDGVIIIRPDSSGMNKDGEVESMEVILLKLLDSLGKAFGVTTNAKGYRVLNPKVRLIQGDGIKYSSLKRILTALTKAGWSIDNLAFGSGGGLLQDFDRDTLKFAFKACYGETVDGSFDIWKDPYHIGKASKRGRLKLVFDGQTYCTVAENDPRPDVLVEVFRDGKMKTNFTFDEIRQRIKPTQAEIDAIVAVI